MTTEAGIRGHIASLNAAEFFVRRRLGAPDASPFLAHIAMKAEDELKFVSSFRAFVNGDGSLIPEAFRRWPLASVWNVATALSKSYGEENHAVYAVLEQIFSAKILQNDREQISLRFRSICRRNGLCYDGTLRMVDDYLAQAGIANAQLHHVARIFLLAERAYGIPPQDNTAALNSWEDDAVHFLPVGVKIPRMVLEVDESAYYAFLYARFRHRLEPRNEYERLFFSELAKAEQSIGAARGVSVARPTLVWGSTGPALSLPKLEGRLVVSFSGKTLKLRGGQLWPLPTPWPREVEWRVGDHTERLTVIESQNHLLAFETERGRLVGQLDANRQSALVVDARDVIVVALSPFSVAGEAAYQIGDGFAAHCPIGTGAAELQFAGRRIQVSAKPKPRIWIENGAVAKGLKGFLVTANPIVGIELGETEPLEQHHSPERERARIDRKDRNEGGHCRSELEQRKALPDPRAFARALVAAVGPFLLRQVEDHVDLHASIDELIEVQDERPRKIGPAGIGVKEGRQHKPRCDDPDQHVPYVDRVDHRGKDRQHRRDHHRPHRDALIDDAPPDEERHGARAEGDGTGAVAQHVAGPAAEVLDHPLHAGTLDHLDRIDRGVGDVDHLRPFREQMIPG